MYAIGKGEERKGNFHLVLEREEVRKAQPLKLTKMVSSPNQLPTSLP